MREVLIAFVLVSALVLASCAEPFGANLRRYEEMHLSLARTLSVTMKIEYTVDFLNYWQSPRETLDRGKGDCEDIALLAAYLLGPEASLVELDCGTMVTHMVVKYGEACYDPQAGVIIDLSAREVLREYTYQEAMAKSTLWGTKGGVL